LQDGHETVSSSMHMAKAFVNAIMLNACCMFET
jgi:hypothetical protein